MARSISFDIAAADKASKALESVAREVTELERKLDGAGGTIEIDADAGKARQEIAAVDAQLARLNAKSLKIDADIAGARRDLQVLEAEAKRATGDRKLKVDADIAAATAKLRALEASKVSVDVETGAAQAKIKSIEQSLDRVGRDRASAKVNVDAAGALGKLAQIGTQLRAIQSPVTITIGIGGAIEALAWIQRVGAGLASLGAAGVGAGAVTAAALSGIGDAFTELGEKSESAGGSVSSSAGSMRSAVRAVEAAQRDLRDANRDVERSEETLSDAQEDARRAVNDLDDARKEAIRTLEDYALQSADMGLRQERAALSVAEAQERLNEVNRDGESTALDRAQAELSVREAIQRQNELAVEATRLTEDKTAADIKGVEQSGQVVAAQDRIKDANKRVEEAQQGIQDAHEQVALAAQRVSDAQLAMQEASQAAGSAGAAAADKQREAFEKLTPEGQRFVTFLRDLVDGPLKDLRDTAQAGLLPGLQEGIEGFMANLGGAKESIAGLAQQTGDFFRDIGPSAGRAADAFLRLANLGAEASFDDIADAVSGALDRFADWANSKDTEEIKEDLHEIADDLRMMWQTANQVLQGIQLAWQATKTMLDGGLINADLLTGDLSGFQDMHKAWKEFTDSFPSIKGLLPEVSGEMGKLDEAARGADGATRGLASASRDVADAQREAADAVRMAKDEFLRGEEAGIRYEAAIDRAEAAVRRNGQAWSTATEKGRDNRQTVLDLVQASQDYLQGLQNQGRGVDEVKAKYEEQRRKLIDVVTQMTGNRTTAQQYIDKLLQVPSERNTTLRVDNDEAMRKTQDLINRIALVNGKTVTISVQADAANVREDRTARLSHGGWLPGAPSDVDSIPLLAAPGEFVVRASSASMYGPLLEAINRGDAAGIAAAMPTGTGAPIPAQRGGGGGGGNVILQFTNALVGQEDVIQSAVIAALGQAAGRGLLPPSLRMVTS